MRALVLGAAGRRRRRPRERSIRAACALCGEKQAELIRTGVRHAPRLEVVRCRRCGLVFLSPQPSERELSRYYEGRYRADYGDAPVEKRFATDLVEARARVRRILPLVRPGARVLEIGAGSGAFLESLRPHARSLTGVEPDTASRHWMETELRLRVYAGIGRIGSRERFDAIFAFHVVEHVLGPVGFLRSLRPLLAARGLIFIETPNVRDALVEVYKVPAYLPFYYQRAHLTYFSRDTLSSALEKAGFVATIDYLQRYDLSNHLYWMLEGKPGGMAKYRDVISRAADAAYSSSLVRTGRADTLWAVAKRRSKGRSG